MIFRLILHQYILAIWGNFCCHWVQKVAQIAKNLVTLPFTDCGGMIMKRDSRQLSIPPLWLLVAPPRRTAACLERHRPRRWSRGRPRCGCRKPRWSTHSESQRRQLFILTSRSLCYSSIWMSKLRQRISLNLLRNWSFWIFLLQRLSLSTWSANNFPTTKGPIALIK